MSDVPEEYEPTDEAADTVLSDGEPWDTGDPDDGRDDFTGPTDGAGPDDVDVDDEGKD